MTASAVAAPIFEDRPAGGEIGNDVGPAGRRGGPAARPPRQSLPATALLGAAGTSAMPAARPPVPSDAVAALAHHLGTSRWTLEIRDRRATRDSLHCTPIRLRPPAGESFYLDPLTSQRRRDHHGCGGHGRRKA